MMAKKILSEVGIFQITNYDFKVSFLKEFKTLKSLNLTKKTPHLEFLL